MKSYEKTQKKKKIIHLIQNKIDEIIQQIKKKIIQHNNKKKKSKEYTWIHKNIVTVRKEEQQRDSAKQLNKEKQ